MNDKESEIKSENNDVIIFANGPLPHEKFVKKYLKNAELIICADGGANGIVDWKIKPDILIGDLDSVTKSTLNELGDITIVRRPDQNATDLQKALEYVDSRFDHNGTVFIFGATRGRLDHFLGNISLLPRFGNRLNIEIVDEQSAIKFVGNKISISGVPGQTVSLWSLSSKTTGVSTSGLKYNLRNETLSQGTLGISNELDDDEATIKVRSGDLLAIITHQKD